MAKQITLGDESKLKETTPDFFASAKTTRSAAGNGAASTSAPILGEQYREVQLSAIVERSPVQHRKPFDPEHDEEDQALLESIRDEGQKIPVVLEEIDGRQPTVYRLRYGHRRCDALTRIGRPTVKALILRLGTLEGDLLTLTENVRKNLSTWEQVLTLQSLRQRHTTLSSVEIAKRTGLSQRYVNRLESLLKINPAFQAKVADGSLSAKAVLELDKAPAEHHETLAELGATHGLNDMEAKRLVDKMRISGAVPAAAALALGLVEGQGDREGGAPADETQPEKSNGAGGRKNKKRTLGVESAGAMLKNFFPELDGRLVRALGEQGQRHSVEVGTLKLAGLLVLANEEITAAVALEAAQSLITQSGMRKMVKVLDGLVEARDLIEQAQLDQKATPIFTALIKKLNGLKQGVTMEKKK